MMMRPSGGIPQFRITLGIVTYHSILNALSWTHLLRLPEVEGHPDVEGRPR